MKNHYVVKMNVTPRTFMWLKLQKLNIKSTIFIQRKFLIVRERERDEAHGEEFIVILCGEEQTMHRLGGSVFQGLPLQHKR